LYDLSQPLVGGGARIIGDGSIVGIVVAVVVVDEVSA
jgi:hypothetical protein